MQKNAGEENWIKTTRMTKAIWNDNIKINLKLKGCDAGRCIEVAEDCVHWW
jgi:hypothetical protein